MKTGLRNACLLYTSITLDDPNEESESYYQISCQFKFRHLDDQRRIEKILLDLILEAKRKKRI